VTHVAYLAHSSCPAEKRLDHGVDADYGGFERGEPVGDRCEKILARRLAWTIVAHELAQSSMAFSGLMPSRIALARAGSSSSPCQGWP